MTDHPTGYVVLSTQRTGSHLLGDVLGGHPDFAHAGEVLIPGTTKRGSLDLFLTLRPQTSSPLDSWRAYLRHLRMPNWSAKYAGFLVKYGHVDRFHGLDLTTSPVFEETRIVHLTRHNVLKTVASHHLAVARKVHVMREHREYSINSVVLDPRALMEAVNARSSTVQAFRDRLRRRGRAIEITYEELADGEHVNPVVIERLCAFFETDDRFSHTPTTVKLSPPRLRDLIENYDEVEREFRGTRYEHMLD